jgi:hypothetical protein
MKPTASPPRFPFPAHRTMAEVMRDEERAARPRDPLDPLDYGSPYAVRRFANG